MMSRSSGHARVPTISSLHMGQTSLEFAAEASVALVESPSSRDILELISWFSEDICEFETSEFNDTELADGESRLELRFGVTAGDNDLPLPKTLPPPSFLEDIVLWSASERRERPHASESCKLAGTFTYRDADRELS